MTRPVCTSPVRSAEDGTYGDCGAGSCFTVARSDGDAAYDAGEACEEHLSDVVVGLIDGDEHVSAVVTARWDDRR